MTNSVDEVEEITPETIGVINQAAEINGSIGARIVYLLVNEVNHLRDLAYPGSHYVRSGQDADVDHVCDTCRYTVDPDEDRHSYRDDCIPNLASTDDFVRDGIQEELTDACKVIERLRDGFKRWQSKNLSQEEFEGLFHELDVVMEPVKARQNEKAP